ncbi:DUF3416 domain-containing protein [bacterium]|nr:DUF3416 domain-containing protein [bacterium]
MSHKVFLFSLLTCLLVGSLYARSGDTVDPQFDYKVYNLEATKVFGAEPGIASNSNRGGEVNRDEADEIEPRGEVEIGDDFLIGYTWYDYQHNGSIGKMIARDSFGGVQFTWMKGYDAGNAERQVVYNYLHRLVDDEVREGELLYDPGSAGTAVGGNPDRSGYCMLSILPTGREDPVDCDLGVVFFHALGYHNAPAPDYVSTAQSVDYRRSYGAFESSYLPSWPNVQLIWPHGAIDRRNYSHVISCQYPGDGGPLWHALGYWRGRVDEDFFEWDWPEVPFRIDTTAVISQVAAASPTSDKVVLAWHHSRIGIPTGPWEEFGGLYQKNSDLRYIVSDDGEEWDWDDGVKSITNIQPIRPDLWDIDRAEAYGDTFRPYCDVDIQFDPWGNDELFASFSTCGFWEYSELNDNGLPAGATAEHSMLWFWSSRLDTLTLVADGYYFNRSPQGGWHSRCGGWRNNTDRPSIAFNPDEIGTVYVVWVNFPKIQELNEAGDGFDYLEGATDTSGLGYSNAEIMVSISTDYGETFQEAYNITETRWMEDDAPDPGECMSENWSSVAYVADDSLHIMYILDLEAGGMAQEEGGTTNNPVIYHRVALDDLDHDRNPIDLPSEGFMFHNWLDLRPWVENGVRDPAVPTSGNSVNVRAVVFPGGDHELTEVLLVYRIDEGDDQSVNMENVGGDTWAGTIPGQPEGTNVWYRIVATNDDNQEGFGPSPIWWWSYVVRDEGGLSIADIQRHDRNWGVDYSPYNGYEVTVEGVVTTSASFNEQYDAYAIQNGEGDWSGLFVRGIEAELDTGTVIRVTGIVMEEDPDEPDKWEYATYIELSEDGLEIISEGGPRPAHTYSDLGELIYSERAEQLEGVLVEIWNFEIEGIYQNALDLGYWAITNESIDGYTWFNTNGLTAVEIKELGLFFSEEDGIVTHTEFSWMKGVFTENDGFYALAPTLSADVGPLAVMDDVTPSPYNFSLDKAYPNPFNAATNVGFEISKRGWTKLALYDLSGRQVMTVAEGDMNPGHYNYVVDAASLSAGLYILRLEADTRVMSQKLVLMK